MDTLATIARHRQVIATVADAILTVAAGDSVRVIIDGGHPDDVTFADHLTQALYARGRACRCLVPRPGADRTRDGMALHGEVADSAAAVMIEATSGRRDSDVLHIHIQVVGPAWNSDDDLNARAAGPARDASDRPGDGSQPHIVVDYLDPDGPAIRRIVPPARRDPR